MSARRRRARPAAGRQIGRARWLATTRGISFKSANKEGTLAEQLASYAALEVPAGTHQPTWMGADPGFQVTYYVGGKNQGWPISGDGSSGTATLTTSTSKAVCGTIDFKSPNGTTIAGTFNVALEKDLWAKTN